MTISQREIDEFHVAAMEYQQQVRMEFQQSLMGKRGMNGERRIGKATVSGETATQQDNLPTGETVRGGQYGGGYSGSR
jgi:hypothetical protein